MAEIGLLHGSVELEDPLVDRSQLRSSSESEYAQRTRSHPSVHPNHRLRSLTGPRTAHDCEPPYFLTEDYVRHSNSMPDSSLTWSFRARRARKQETRDKRRVPRRSASCSHVSSASFRSSRSLGRILNASQCRRPPCTSGLRNRCSSCAA